MIAAPSSPGKDGDEDIIFRVLGATARPFMPRTQKIFPRRGHGSEVRIQVSATDVASCASDRQVIMQVSGWWRRVTVGASMLDWMEFTSCNVQYSFEYPF